jgi:predicted chitinase
MAEVTGDLNGQPIQLNNAATEVTLKQILAAMLAQVQLQSKNTKSDAKLQKELEKELERLAKASKKQREETDKNTEASKKSTKAKEDEEDAAKKAKAAREKEIAGVNNFANGIMGATKSALGLASGMANLISTLAKTGNSLEGAAGAMSSIPVVGGVLAGVFGAVAAAAEKTYESFKQSASVGANFGGSINAMVSSASAAGLTFEQFSGMIAKQGQNLALLGGSTEEGAKRLAQLGKQIKGSPIAAELNRLGYSTEAINEGMASYAGQLAKTGALQGMTNAQLVAGTGAYLRDLDSLTKLTGKNKKELEDERNARLKDAQFRFIMSKMDADSQKNLHNLMDSIPAEHQEGMKEIIATGTATSEAGKKALAFLPDSAKNMMSLNQQIRTTGKMGADQAAQINSAYQREVKAFTQSGVAENMALYGDEASKKFFVGAADAAARSEDLAQVQAKAKKTAEETAKKGTDGLDPAAMEAMKTKIAETSNAFSMILANSGLLNELMKAFTMLTDFTMTVVVPAFKWLSDNFTAVAIGVGAALAVFGVLKAVVFAATAIQALQTLGVTVSLAPLAAFAAGLLSVAAPILLVVGAGVLLYKGFQAIADKVKSAGWTFSDVFEAIGDNIKRFAINYVDIWLSIAEKIAKFFGGGDKITAMREGLKLEKDELDAKEKARDERREQQGEAYKREKAAKLAEEEKLKAAKESTATTKESTEAKKKETEAVAAATTPAAANTVPGVNLSSPQAMYDSMIKRQQSGATATTTQPGAASTAPVTGVATPPPMNQDQAKNMELVKAALQKQGITDPKYIAATLGNVMKETGGKSQSENLNYGKTDNSRIRSIFGSRAAGKTDAELDTIKKDPQQMGEMMYGKDTKIGQQMGNNEPGDGFKYRGRGFIQLTGKSNYSAASKAIYGDDRLVKNPDLVNDPAVAAEVSAWYMKKGQASMAKSMGIDTKNMTQADANALATSQIAGRDVKKAGGYLGGENLSKVNAYAAQMAGVAGAPVSGAAQTALASNIPTTAAVQTAVTPTPAAGATTQQAEAARAQAAATDPRRSDRAPTAVAGARQETPESLLASLNTKLDQLITINRSLKDTNERQLSVQKNIAQSGDLYVAA